MSINLISRLNNLVNQVESMNVAPDKGGSVPSGISSLVQRELDEIHKEMFQEGKDLSLAGQQWTKGAGKASVESKIQACKSVKAALKKSSSNKVILKKMMGANDSYLQALEEQLRLLSNPY